MKAWPLPIDQRSVLGSMDFIRFPVSCRESQAGDILRRALPIIGSKMWLSRYERLRADIKRNPYLEELILQERQHRGAPGAARRAWRRLYLRSGARGAGGPDRHRIRARRRAAAQEH